MASRQSRVIMQQFAKATRTPSEYCKYVMDKDNINTWYTILHNFSGNDNEYEGGEYLVRIELPDDFPHSPPHFYFLTENGLYGVGTKVCISIGEYHKDNYRAVLGVDGFCNNLISGLVGWKEMGHGIAITKTTAVKKAKLASESVASNMLKHPDLVNQVNASYNEYVKKWDPAQISPTLRVKLGIRAPGEGSSGAASVEDITSKLSSVSI